VDEFVMAAVMSARPPRPEISERYDENARQRI
jgi:hypothetical protein